MRSAADRLSTEAYRPSWAAGFAGQQPGGSGWHRAGGGRHLCTAPSPATMESHRSRTRRGLRYACCRRRLDRDQAWGQCSRRHRAFAQTAAALRAKYFISSNAPRTGSMRERPNVVTTKCRLGLSLVDTGLFAAGRIVVQILQPPVMGAACNSVSRRSSPFLRWLCFWRDKTRCA